MTDRSANPTPPSTAGLPASPSLVDAKRREIHNYAPWLNVLCGLAVFTLRYALPPGTYTVHWNLFLTGFVVIFAALATTIAHGDALRNFWPSINIVAGAWIIVSARAFPSDGWISEVQEGLGIVIVILALVSLIMEIVSRRVRATNVHER